MPPLLLSILLDWRTWAGVAIIAAAAWLHHDGVMGERHKWQAAMATQKAEAAKLLSEATARTRAVEAHNDQLGKQLEVDNAKAQTASDQMLADNRALARQLGGLRDPGRRPSSGCPVPGPAGTATVDPGTDPGAVLSDQAQEFLFEFARSADRTRDQLRTCQAWAIGIGNAPRMPPPP